MILTPEEKNCLYSLITNEIHTMNEVLTNTRNKQYLNSAESKKRILENIQEKVYKK